MELQEARSEAGRIDIERYLDMLSAYRDYQELIEMNGRKCGSKQAGYLKRYRNGVQVRRWDSIPPQARRKVIAAKSQAKFANGKSESDRAS